MKNSDLQSIWKSLDKEIHLTPKNELKALLDKKIRKAMNKFNSFIALSAAISIGFITFLIITALNRSNDTWYQINNLFVGILTAISPISSVITWKKLNQNKNNLPLKEWLKERIKLLKREITGNLVWYFIPVFAVPSILSIHVYYEKKLFIEVLATALANEESVYGLIFGLIIGGLVAVFTVLKIRKYQKKQLEYLNEIYRRLED